MFSFSRTHAAVALALFAVEVCIAAFVHDRFVRPHVGDLLVVMLIHFAVRTGVNMRPARVATGAFLFACAVEASQGLHLIARLGLQHNTFARLLLGDTFQALDLLAYALGALIAWQLDERLGKRSS